MNSGNFGFSAATPGSATSGNSFGGFGSNSQLQKPSFGSSSNFPSSQPTSASATFGGFGSSNNATAPSSFGAFGSSSTASSTAFGTTALKSTPGFSGFGSTPTSTSGFGAAQQPSTGGFGGFTLGANAPAAKAAPIGFGAPASTGLSGFGAPASTGLSGFGAPASTGLSGFGAPASTGFSGFSAPASTGLSGFGAPASTGLSGFGTPASTGLSGFGAPASTGLTGFGAPASTGFSGFGAPTLTGFSGFGAPASTGLSGFGAPASTGFSGFGAPASTGLSGFGTPASTGLSGFGAPASTGFSGFGNQTSTGLAGFGSTHLAAQSTFTDNVCEFPVDTIYTDMPANYKQELDRTWKELKQPMKLKLDEIARFRGQAVESVAKELHAIHLAVLKVENEQLALQHEVRPFLEELQQTSDTARLQAVIGMQQIKSKNTDANALALLANYAAGLGMESEFHQFSGGGMSSSTVDEQLPCKWYLFVAEKLTSRLSVCLEAVRNYERQLSVRLQAVRSRGAYGQVRKIGLSDLVQLMQEQAKVFLQVASAVAAVHKETDLLRRAFLLLLEQHRRDGSKQIGATIAKDSVNPFDAADRKEAAEQRMLEQRLAAEAVKYQKQQLLVGSNTAPPSTAASSSLTTMPLTLGTGAVGFASTGLTPSSNTASAASSGFNFGSSFGNTTPALSSTGPSFGTNGAGGTSTTAALDLATSATGLNGFGSFSSPVGGFGSSVGLNSKKGKKKS